MFQKSKLNKFNDTQFCWYVLGEDKVASARYSICMRNIFNCSSLNTYTNKLCKLLYKDKISFGEFKDKLREELAYHLRSRSEYEINALPLHEYNVDMATKVDYYTQAVWNINALAREVILQYEIKNS